MCPRDGGGGAAADVCSRPPIVVIWFDNEPFEFAKRSLDDERVIPFFSALPVPVAEEEPPSPIFARRARALPLFMNSSRVALRRYAESMSRIGRLTPLLVPFASVSLSVSVAQPNDDDDSDGSARKLALKSPNAVTLCAL